METDADHRYANTASETDVSKQVCMVYEAHERTHLLAAQTAQGQSRGSTNRLSCLAFLIM